MEPSENLKELCNDDLHAYHLDSTINMLFDVLYHISIYQSINPSYV